MGRGNKTIKTSILVLAAFSMGAVTAVAQTPNSSFVGNIGLTTQVDVDTNSNLSSVSPGTTVDVAELLSFSLRTENRSQFFDISANTALRFSRMPGGGSDFTVDDPTFDIQYFRQSANSDVDLNIGYWSGDVSSAYDADPTTAVFIVVDTGSLTVADASATFRTGLRGPVGLTADVSRNTRDYSGTTDPNLFDTETTTLGLQASLRFSPVTQGRVSVRRTDYSDQNIATPTDTETMTYTFGVTNDIKTGLTLSANAGYRDRVSNTGGPSGTRSGIFGSVDITQARPNGTLTAGASFDNAAVADRVSLTFGRSLNLPDGQVSANLTATNISGIGWQVYGNANYTKQFSSGSLDVSLDRSLTTNARDEDIRFTSLALGYQQQINTGTDLNLSLDLSRSEDGGAGSAPTQNRATFSASYSRAVTSDWDLSLGYRHRQYSSSTTADANSDAVFLSLSRNVQFGF